MNLLSREELQAIAKRLAPYIHRTPLLHSSTLSKMTGLNVYLKAELFQKTGSYKTRGMTNALMTLGPDERERGVITFSSGNAAQGLAYAAGILGIKAIVAMPEKSSAIKVQAARDYGAEVILHGTSQECLAYCQKLTKERGLTFLSSYNDLSLMKGHATLGLEVVEDLNPIDAILVGVGGGGMLGGIALALEACGSNAALIGVEPVGAPAMHKSFAENRAVYLDHVQTVADGLMPPDAGELCFEIARRRVREIALVSDDDIIAAMLTMMQRCKLYAEPSAAAGLAALLSGAVKLPPNATVVCVVSGGNLDPQRLKAFLD